MVPAEWPTDRHRRLAFDVAAMVVLAVMVLVLGCKDIRVGGFGWSDAPLHAMDGVALYDLVRTRAGGQKLSDWAAQYYARYPCLGLLVYYPPFHPLIEAAAYALFGVSEAVARGTVVFMALPAVLGLYCLGVLLFGRPAAWCAAGLMATVPFGLPWLRDVMLEWPAAAMAILATVCYRKWYAGPSWRWTILCALCTAAAILTKQTTLFLPALFALHLVVVGAVATFRGNWPPKRTGKPRLSEARLAMMVASAALLILAILGAYGLVDKYYADADFSRSLVSGRRPWHHLGELNTYTQYFQWCDEILGWPLIVACLIGMAAIIVQRQWQGIRFVLLWFGIVWLQQTLVAWKEPRYLFFAIPAVTLLTGRGWTYWPRRRKVPVGLVVLTLLIGYQFVSGVMTPTRRLPDYAAAVQLLVQRGDADVVLVDAVRDGQFVFDVRSNPGAADRIITLRGSKMLYSRAARARWRHTTHRDTPEKITELLHQYGIRYIVVESQLPDMPEAARADWDEPAAKVLRSMLTDTDRFELIGRFPLDCGDPAWADVELRVYHHRQAPPRQLRTIVVPIPAMNKEVKLTLPPPGRSR